MEKISKQDCEKWQKEPDVNPLTGRKIQKGKGVYLQLEKNCDKYFVEEKTEEKVEEKTEEKVEEKKEGWVRSKTLKSDCVPPAYRWIDKDLSKGYKRGWCEEKIVIVKRETEEKYTKMGGLTIGVHKFSQVGGPEYVNVLVPKVEMFEKYKKMGIILPVFVNFGDVHTNFRYDCDKKQGVNIFSDVFAKALSSISTEKYPVDFYIERFFNKDQIKELMRQPEKHYKNIKKINPTSEGTLENVFFKNESCFLRELDPKIRSTTCDATNVRWQFADARWLRYTVRQGFESPYWFEGMFSNFLHFLQTKDKSTFIADLVKTFIELCEKSKIDPSVAVLELVQLGHMLLIKDQDFYKTFLGKTIFNKVSLIHKQLSKGDPKFKKEIVDRIIYHLGSKSQLYSRLVMEELEKVYTLYAKFFIDFVQNYDNISKKEIESRLDKLTMSKYFEALFVKKLVNLLDIYFILRVFKTSESKPKLVLTLFGMTHSKNLKKFFVDDFELYDCIYEKEYHKKCVKFSESIDLNTYLERYN